MDEIVERNKKRIDANMMRSEQEKSKWQKDFTMLSQLIGDMK
jgi:hypothetical protein